jgi:hypothetical protein
MTQEGHRMLAAIASAERAAGSSYLPLKRIALRAVEGDAACASRLLAALDAEGCIQTDTMGWQGGWITDKGRLLSRFVA